MESEHQLGGIVGVLAASLCNVDRPWRSTATRFAGLGFGIAVAIGIVRLIVSGTARNLLLALVFVVLGGLGIA